MRGLYERLERDGVPCCYSPESIRLGADFVRALERALDECEFIVFVLSPDFVNSEWTQLERTSVLAGDAHGARRKPARCCGGYLTFPAGARTIR